MTEPTDHTAGTDLDDATLAAEARRQLDASTRALDELTVARLRSARQQALDAVPAGRAWQRPLTWAAGALLASGLAAAVLLPLAWHPASDLPGDEAAIEVLAWEEDPAFYDDLDFILWLEDSGHGQG